MVLVFYGLSAPHTAHLIGMITPNFVGQYLAPIGFELGVLIVAALIEANWRNYITVGILWFLLLLSIVINVAGSFIAVIDAATTANISGDTMGQLLGRYSDLPATFQVVLALVVPVGVLIPIIAKLAGEGIVKLALGKVRLEQQSDEQRWAENRVSRVYTHLYNEALRMGAGTKTAANWAQSVVAGLYREDVAQMQTNAASKQHLPVPSQPARAMGFMGQLGQSGTVQISPKPAEIVSTIDQPQVQKDSNDSPDAGLSDVRVKKSHVVEWLRANPEMLYLDNRTLSKLYMQEFYGYESDSAYKTVERAKREVR